MNNSVIGLEIAKNIFHLFTLLADGKALLNVLPGKSYQYILKMAARIAFVS